jgi:hypothetical protein
MFAIARFASFHLFATNTRKIPQVYTDFAADAANKSSEI